MATKGPIPKPPEQLASWRGDPNRKGSSAHNTPKPKKGSPPMPPDLPDGAREVWLRTLPLLESSKVITVIDGDVLRDYSVAVMFLQDCVVILNRDGFSKKGEKGDRTYLTPEAQMYPRLVATVSRLSDKLGLSPSARTRIQATPIEEPADDEAGKKRAAIAEVFNGMVPGEG